MWFSIVDFRLSEIPNWKILLLEAGGEEPFQADVPAYIAFTWGTRLDWGYTTVPQPQACAGQPCGWIRGKVLGGSSVVHAMIYNRGNRFDYDHWQELGKKVWLLLGFKYLYSERLGSLSIYYRRRRVVCHVITSMSRNTIMLRTCHA